jgi:hypothetical protein
MPEQYLTTIQLQKYTPAIDFSSVRLISTDSYSDEEVWKSILATGDSKTLAVCALQTSIVGLGNKTYGQFEYQGVEKTVAEVYSAKGVKVNSTLGSKLSPGDLTPRRLNRAFRLLIQDYLIQNPAISSYLWRKYTKQDPVYRTSCFPGSEHLVNTNEQAEYLYSAYKELDLRLDTKISERVLRVLNARGLILLLH